MTHPMWWFFMVIAVVTTNISSGGRVKSKGNILKPPTSFHQSHSTYQQSHTVYQQPQSTYQQSHSTYQQPHSTYQQPHHSIPQSVNQQQTIVVNNNAPKSSGLGLGASVAAGVGSALITNRLLSSSGNNNNRPAVQHATESTMVVVNNEYVIPNAPVNISATNPNVVAPNRTVITTTFTRTETRTVQHRGSAGSAVANFGLVFSFLLITFSGRVIV